MNPIPHMRREAVTKELEEWECWGIIGKWNSPHNNTLHATDKSDGSIRPVWDIIPLNKYVVCLRIHVDNVSSFVL